ncbi:MAG: ABC transporter permease, partial [Chloroflexota bacterium]|nr:ABC transporter permease [Chloroflexota bacterium]
YIVPYAVLIIFFLVITMSSSFMLHSVTAEKENRIVEVLLLSLRPRELMLGKILGLGVVALLQITIWLGGSLLTVRHRGLFKLASDIPINLPPGFIGWAGCYFLLGYLLFASALGALGALAPNAREGNQFTFIVLLPLMIPLWLQTTFNQAPHGGLATFFSIFPLTSPVSMMARLAVVNVPRWQILTSLGLLLVTTYGLVLLAAHFFRADTLLSNASLNWQRLKSMVRGGE